MIVRFLSPVEQGFYYALWSLVALQSVFELGFSFVILQVAAHERAHLTVPTNGLVTGSETARSRLASVLQIAVRWYAVVAVLMFCLLNFGGACFFTYYHSSGHSILWQMPLRLTALACSITFSIGPVLSFLEGCGQVSALARMRLLQSLVSTAAAWTAMLSHHGLYAPSMVLFGQGVVAALFLYSRRGLLLPLLRIRVAPLTLNWRQEVWPFQWKIAVSWLCDYFIFQLLTPVLFAFRGPVEAGRMGVSMSIVMQLGGIMLLWMTTKAAPFGTMVARGERTQLDAIFSRTLRQSLELFAAAAICVLAGTIFIDHDLPAFSVRFVSWPIFLLLLMTALSAHVVQSEALYLRAHKCEPFLVQSVVMAAATAGSVLLLARDWGTAGVSLAYFIVMGMGGIFSATIIFRLKRRRWTEMHNERLRAHFPVAFAGEQF